MSDTSTPAVAQPATRPPAAAPATTAAPAAPKPSAASPEAMPAFVTAAEEFKLYHNGCSIHYQRRQKIHLDPALWRALQDAKAPVTKPKG